MNEDEIEYKKKVALVNLASKVTFGKSCGSNIQGENH